MGLSESICVPENELPTSFDWNYPVLRRGCLFSFSLKKDAFDTTTTESSDKIQLSMLVNGEALDDNKIMYCMEQESKSHWNLSSSKGWTDDKVIYHLETPCDCEIGEYEVTIRCGDNILGKEKFLMLCNPWNPSDEVYLLEESDREEYIESQQTLTFKGNSSCISKNIWSLDQFSEEAIETLLYLLKKIDKNSRSSAFDLSRELTTLVSSLADDGILVYHAEENYLDGKSPEYWSGSKEIFKKYLKKKQPVKYGNSETVSGVLCSPGIGCRIVTGLDIPRKNNSSDIKVYYDKNFNIIPQQSDDGIWTFHCWNECYMRCPNFNNYNGWQACDGTPREKSIDGLYTCGPTPVDAIKKGDLSVGYGTQYLFNQVNSKCIVGVVVDGNSMLCTTQPRLVSQKIITKCIQTVDILDITSSYKYNDNSMLEALAMNNSEYSLLQQTNMEKVVEIKPARARNYIFMGEDLDVTLNFLQPFESYADVAIKCFVIQHQNARSEELFIEPHSFRALSNKKIAFTVNYKSILDMVKSDLSSVLVEVFVGDRGKLHMEEAYFSLKTPSFNVILPDKCSINEKFEISVRANELLNYNTDGVRVKVNVDFTDAKYKQCLRSGLSDPVLAKFDATINKQGFHEVKAIIYGPHIPTFQKVATINIV